MKTLLTLIAVALIAVITWVSSLQAQSPYARGVNAVSAELASGSLTATGSAGANTVTGFTQACAKLLLENTTGVEIDALVGSAQKRVPAGTVRDLGGTGGLSVLAPGTVVKAYHGATGPTFGSFEAFCLPQ